MNSPQVALLIADANQRALIRSAMDDRDLLITEVDDLAAPPAELRLCTVAFCDGTLQPSSGEPAGVAVRRQLRTGGAVIALFDETTADLESFCRRQEFDDFCTYHTPGHALRARIDQALQTRRNRSVITREGQDFEVLFELAQLLADPQTVQSKMHDACRLIARALHLEHCAVMLLDSDRGRGQVVATSEHRVIHDLRIDIEAYPELQRLARGRSPVLITSRAGDPNRSEVGNVLAAQGVESELLFPITDQERVYGALMLYSSAPFADVAERDSQFGMALAAVVGIAIRNARLLDSFRDHTKRINLVRLQAERRIGNFQNYEDFFEYAADGMAVLDGSGQLLYLNLEVHRVLGQARSDLKGAPLASMLGEGGLEVLNHILKAIGAGQQCRNVDLPILNRNGEERSLSVSASPLGTETNAAVLSFRDVTEMREMQTELRATKDFLENLIDSSVDGIVAADLRGKVLLFNKGAERIYRYSVSEVIGNMPVWKLYPSGVAQEIMHELRSQNHGGVGRLVQKRTEVLIHDRTRVPVSLTASIVYEDRREVATLGIISDLRERLRIEQDLDYAKSRLVESEKQAIVAELAGTAAHELNQPLTSVVGYSEMLRRKIGEDDPLRRPVDIIYREAERMAELVRKIGKITRYKTKPYSTKTRMLDLDKASSVTPDPPTGWPVRIGPATLRATPDESQVTKKRP